MEIILLSRLFGMNILSILDFPLGHINVYDISLGCLHLKQSTKFSFSIKYFNGPLSFLSEPSLSIGFMIELKSPFKIRFWSLALIKFGNSFKKKFLLVEALSFCVGAYMLTIIKP